MNRNLFRACLFALLAAVIAVGEGTQRWTQSSFEEFEKGTVKGVAIRSDGTLELAPAFTPVATTPSAYIWAITSDPDGNVFAATGSPARIYRLTPSGQASIIFQPQELQVQALVADKNGVLYAATSPDGKIYKIERKTAAAPATPAKKAGAKTNESASAKNEAKTAAAPTTPQTDQNESAKTPVDDSYTSSVFFDPKTKYIWDLAFDSTGRLYAATGDHGEIFRIESNGTGSVFFKSDEAHIRVLAFDHQDNLIAGTDGSGLIYRISPAGEAFVLYSAAKKEITALAVDKDGNIYAAGVGEKRPAGMAGGQPTVVPMISQPVITSIGGGITVGAGQQAPIIMPGVPFMGQPMGGSELYIIAPDGSPRRIWSPKDDIIYALAFDTRGNLIVGTGNRGRIYIVKPDGSYTDLVHASANQVIGFARAAGRDTGLYCATSNLGKVFLLSSATEPEGTYDSDVFDAKVFSKWGRAEVRGGGRYEILARSGNVDNPDRNWSPWRRVDVDRNLPLDVPQARFVQWRAVLHAAQSSATLDSVSINYRAKNVAPVIEDVAAQVGARFNPPPKVSPENQPIQIGPSNQAPPPKIDFPTPAVRDRDSIAVRWSAHDDNDDDLTYSVYYRGDGEHDWKLLKDKITDKFYSWDAGLLPDGGYTVRVVASDAPSHSPDEALTAFKDSARFEVDHTPPAVADLAALLEGADVHVTFRGVDGFSPIKRAEYSIDAGDWQFIEPVGQLSDSKVENYDFEVPLPAAEPAPPGAAPTAVPTTTDTGRTPGGGAAAAQRAKAGEHVIVIRVYDRYDNMGTSKAVVTSR